MKITYEIRPSETAGKYIIVNMSNGKAYPYGIREDQVLDVMKFYTLWNKEEGNTTSFEWHEE